MRFHAMQSIVVFGILTILSLVPVVGWILSPLVMIVGFALWLVLIYKAYQGEEFKLPLIEIILGRIPLGHKDTKKSLSA